MDSHGALPTTTITSSSSSSSSSPRRSTLILLCAVANFINAADRILMSIAIVPISKEFKIGLHAQGWIHSAFPFGYISSQLIGGKAAQRYGGKRVLSLAVFLWSLSTLVTPACTRYPKVLICMRVLLGFGEGLGLPTIFHVLGRDVPSQERSRAFGYLVALGSLGQMLASLICPHLYWANNFYLLGFAGFLWLPFWAYCYEEKKTTTMTTKDYGLPTTTTTKTTMAAGDEEEEREGLLFDAGEVTMQRSSAKYGASGGRCWRRVFGGVKSLCDAGCRYFTCGALWAIYLAHFAMNWSNYILMNWLPTYLTQQFDVDVKSISYIALPYLANSAMNIVSGHYADSLVSRRTTSLLSVRRLMTSVGLFGPAVALLFFCAVSSFPLALFFVTCSMGLCAFNSAGHLANHADIAPQHAGITFAISNTIATIPGILCGPFTAELVSQSGNRWFPVFVLASFINAVGAIIYLVHSQARQLIS